MLTHHHSNIRKVTEEEISDWFTEKLSEELSIPHHDIDIEKSFTEFGLDSMAAICIAGELEDWIGVTISATLLWDYPTIRVLSRYLVDQTATAEVYH